MAVRSLTHHIFLTQQNCFKLLSIIVEFKIYFNTIIFCSVPFSPCTFTLALRYNLLARNPCEGLLQYFKQEKSMFHSWLPKVLTHHDASRTNKTSMLRLATLCSRHVSKPHLCSVFLSCLILTVSSPVRFPLGHLLGPLILKTFCMVPSP